MDAISNKMRGTVRPDPRAVWYRQTKVRRLEHNLRTERGRRKYLAWLVGQYSTGPSATDPENGISIYFGDIHHQNPEVAAEAEFVACVPKDKHHLKAYALYLLKLAES